MSRWLITAPNEFVATMISQGLDDAGIRSFALNAQPRPINFSGSQDIYVEDPDLDRAREILKRLEVHPRRKANLG